ncbi:MAG: L,D-transpeptidase [Sandaracinaceae bacterium]
MRRNGLILVAAVLACAGMAWGLAVGCGGGEGGRSSDGDDDVAIAAEEPAPDPVAVAAARAEAELVAMLDREYPMHGMVTAAQIPVRSAADREAQVIGWLRLGGHVRARRESVTSPRCNSGWYELYPRGWACAGQGIEMTDHPPEHDDAGAHRDEPLPYRYLVVTQPQTPEYHQPPSREIQREAADHGARYAELLNAGQERRAALLREGRLAGEPRSPAAVVRYLHRNFYVASNGVETRSARRFARTVRGSYVREAELEERTGSDFAGVALDGETTLPIAWAVRESRPLRRVVHPDESVHIRPNPDAPTWERQTVVPWLRRENVEGRDYHVVDLGDGQEGYLRRWFVAVAERIDPPSGVREDEPWVHVDVSEQTAGVYRGATPIYTTLVSTGIEGHDTPIGEFEIHRKYVSDTMANPRWRRPRRGRRQLPHRRRAVDPVLRGLGLLHLAPWHHASGCGAAWLREPLAARRAPVVLSRPGPRFPLGGTACRRIRTPARGQPRPRRR